MAFVTAFSASLRLMIESSNGSSASLTFFNSDMKREIIKYLYSINNIISHTWKHIKMVINIKKKTSTPTQTHWHRKKDNSLLVMIAWTRLRVGKSSFEIFFWLTAIISNFSHRWLLSYVCINQHIWCMHFIKRKNEVKWGDELYNLSANVVYIHIYLYIHH